MELHLGGEEAALVGMLELQREAIDGLLEDLSDDEARLRLVPSLTTPLGLVKHAAFVERVWFAHRVGGGDRRALGLPDAVDDTFRLGPDDTIGSVRADFAAACARSRDIAAEHDLDERFTWREKTVTLRFVYLHMIREFARHAGHGDILAEQIRARRP
ncbi:DinB family protein [Zhihengliuella salsuginis]|uniref:DinB family protein n=1 Tax=Zhihengliuella salsuginis TaxID=578222 RepID=A0ABQ3GEU8_9MICC|nr:DinB family protein [Zhihengliuella salsuginis]GHD03894.1 hypothetical protein GCM10008096_10550 [Zhihengliuella salsuginis]